MIEGIPLKQTFYLIKKKTRKTKYKVLKIENKKNLSCQSFEIPIPMSSFTPDNIYKITFTFVEKLVHCSSTFA